jgi:hypothetical protein
MRADEQAQRARCCVASALSYATDEWPDDLRAALACPRSAWPSDALADLAAWLTATKRQGLAPTLEKLGAQRPALISEAIALDAAGLPLGIAALEAKTFVDYVRGTDTMAELSALVQRLAEDPTKAERFLAVAVPQLQGLAASFHSGPKLTVLSPDEILALKTDPQDNLIGSRLLTRRGQLVIAGAGGVGKSRLALQLAVAVITGQPFFGLRTHAPGSRWLVLQAENDPTRQRADLEALRAFAGDAWPKVNDCLHLHALVSETDGFLSLDDAGCVARIRGALDTFRPDVVVLDSLYNFGIGDLNKDADMRATLTELARVMRHRNPNRALVVLHHATTGKGGLAKLAGHDRASVGRNSKVLHSWARGVVNVAPVSEDTNDVLAIVCGKSNNGPEFPPFAIRLNRERMVYEEAADVDVKDAITSASNGAPVVGSVSVEDVVELAHGQTKGGLARRIMSDSGCQKTAAYKAITKAEETKAIKLDRTSRTYVVTRLIT